MLQIFKRQSKEQRKVKAFEKVKADRQKNKCKYCESENTVSPTNYVGSDSADIMTNYEFNEEFSDSRRLPFKGTINMCLDCGKISGRITKDGVEGS